VETSGGLVVSLPTPYGHFDAHAFERPSGFVYLALVMGDVTGADDVLVRIHSECLTGDALGSLRCDCGVQLRLGLRAIAAEGRGVLIYATGQEGRGIGLMNKLRAYLAQERGADTVDANHLLGLPADARDYHDAAEVVRLLGVGSVRLMTNNPAKVAGLRSSGIEVRDVVPVRTVPHPRNERYLSTKAERMGHDLSVDRPLERMSDDDVDPRAVLGTLPAPTTRPAVVVKLAQSLDGRIATAGGDSKWISSEAERRLAHGLRAACDAVMVGVGTVANDDPQLTVRAVPGASPVRVVVDSMLRAPVASRLFNDDGSTVVLTTEASDERRRSELRRSGVAVEVVASRGGRVDLAAALAHLRAIGMDVVLVEGGSQLVTSLLREGLVDRMIVAVAPLVLGSGIPAVGDLCLQRVADGIHLVERTVVTAGDDIVVAGTVSRRPAT
jgi:GTP cyclohydrolase II